MSWQFVVFVLGLIWAAVALVYIIAAYGPPNSTDTVEEVPTHGRRY